MDLVRVLYDLKDNKAQYIKEYGPQCVDDFDFMGKCISHFNKTKSQNFQDVFAHHCNPAGGWYVEFGACDGKDAGSNTYMLNQLYDWGGILAEPNPVWHYDLMKNRPDDDISFDCVWTKSGEVLEFNATNEPQLSTISGYGKNDEHANQRKSGKLIQVNTISLFDLMEKYNSYNHPGSLMWNYLSIDTEGSEYDILKQFFEDSKGRYTFKCVTVEHNFQPVRQQIFDLMTSQGYIRKYEFISRWDDFYCLV